jgi:2,5-furandicarboxylate decarboxylase 1
VSQDLRTFLRAADAAGEPTARVSRSVSTVHELSAVVKVAERHRNPIITFGAVDGSDFPVVTGVWGSRRRIALALGTSVDELTDVYLDRLEKLAMRPVDVAEAPVKDVLTRGGDVDLGALPLCVHAPGDAGRYITSGVCLARDPASGAINAGIYRMMVHSRNQITISADPGQDLAQIFASARERGESVEVVTIIGGHPSLAVASQAKVPVDVDFLEVASSLLNEPLGVVPAETVSLPVPALAEFAIEGRVDPSALQHEGPFGEFSYYYGTSDAPLCEVTAISHRKDAIYVDIHPTHKEHRCLAIAPAREARVLRALRTNYPGVRSVHIPLDSAGVVAWVSIEKTHDGDPRQLGLLALGTDTLLKHVTVVDADINPFDPGAVLWALSVRFQADRDLLLVPYAKGFAEDPSSYSLGDRTVPRGLTTKTVTDATLPLEVERPPRADLLPENFRDLDLDDYLDAPG